MMFIPRSMDRADGLLDHLGKKEGRKKERKERHITSRQGKSGGVGLVLFAFFGRNVAASASGHGSWSWSQLPSEQERD